MKRVSDPGLSGGCQARSKAQGSGPCPVGVRGFKSHPPHQYCTPELWGCSRIRPLEKQSAYSIRSRKDSDRQEKLVRGYQGTCARCLQLLACSKGFEFERPRYERISLAWENTDLSRFARL